MYILLVLRYNLRKKTYFFIVYIHYTLGQEDYPLTSCAAEVWYTATQAPYRFYLHLLSQRAVFLSSI